MVFNGVGQADCNNLNPPIITLDDGDDDDDNDNNISAAVTPSTPSSSFLFFSPFLLIYNIGYFINHNYSQSFK